MLIWLSSYPRSGSTFFRLILHQFLGIPTYSLYSGRQFGRKLKDKIGHIQRSDFISMRKENKIFFVKTHDRYQKHQANDKVIYIVSDGRDALCSYSRFVKGQYDPEHIIANIQKSNPRYCWHNHVLNWAQANRIVIKFEDLICNPKMVLDVLSQLNLPFHARDVPIPTFRDLCAKWPHFFTRGIVGEHKEYLDFPTKLFNEKAGEAMRLMGYKI